MHGRCSIAASTSCTGKLLGGQGSLADACSPWGCCLSIAHGCRKHDEDCAKTDSVRRCLELLPLSYQVGFRAGRYVTKQ